MDTSKNPFVIAGETRNLAGIQRLRFRVKRGMTVLEAT